MTAAAMSGPGRHAWTLAVLIWNERTTVRAYQEWVPTIFTRISAHIGADFQQILDEECSHVAWGHGVLSRLEREDPAMFRRGTACARLVRRTYPTLLHAAHARLSHDLRVRLGGAEVRH
jgi:hypothetical protein